MTLAGVPAVPGTEDKISSKKEAEELIPTKMHGNIRL